MLDALADDGLNGALRVPRAPVIRRAQSSCQ